MILWDVTYAVFVEQVSGRSGADSLPRAAQVASPAAFP